MILRKFIHGINSIPSRVVKFVIYIEVVKIVKFIPAPGPAPMSNFLVVKRARGKRQQNKKNVSLSRTFLHAICNFGKYSCHVHAVKNKIALCHNKTDLKLERVLSFYSHLYKCKFHKIQWQWNTNPKLKEIPYPNISNNKPL